MKQTDLSIAVTGGIGTGKSQVCRIFSEKGIPVFSADQLGHKALKNKAVISSLIKLFGNSIMEDDKVDRQKLSELVFEDKKKVTHLNSIVHPYIIKELKMLLANPAAPLVVYEIPLLFEVDLEKLFDIIIVVSSHIDIRKARVAKRSGLSSKRFEEIADKQFPQELAREKADFVIKNNDSLADLEKKVVFVLNCIKSQKEM